MFRKFSGYYQLAFLLFFLLIGVGLISFYSKSFVFLNRLDYFSDVKINNNKQSFEQEFIQYKNESKVENASFKGQREEDGKLNLFFESIENLSSQGGSYHIAYFGDSQIEGDLLTQGLRDRIQKKWGGNGIGWMPITSIVSGFRVTINHGFNEFWEVVDFKSYNRKQPYPVGPTGQVFGGVQGAYCNYTSRSYPFQKVQLIAHPKSTGQLNFNFDQKTTALNWPDPVHPSYVHDLWNVPFNKMKLNVIEGNPQLYGVNFEKGDGVYVDNFGFRGNTGNSLTSLNPEMLQSIGKDIKTSLVVFHYGLNVIGHGVEDYHNYEITMSRSIEHLKICYPHAAILVIGMTDKAYKENGKWDTDPTVFHLLKTQQKVAKEHGVAYFSLFDAMGGPGSIRSWVQDSVPRLANSDYTHMTHNGCDYLSQYIYQYLIDSYDYYKENKK